MGCSPIHKLTILICVKSRPSLTKRKRNSILKFITCHNIVIPDPYLKLFQIRIELYYGVFVGEKAVFSFPWSVGLGD